MYGDEGEHVSRADQRSEPQGNAGPAGTESRPLLYDSAADRDQSGATPTGRPELYLGAAFAGGLLLAWLLKKRGSGDG